MQREEITALGELAGDAAAGTAVQIYELHAGIARRVWRAVGPAAVPVRFVHDKVAGSAYSAARDLTKTVVNTGVAAVSALQPPDAASIEDTFVGRAVVGALNGVFGDTLVRRRNRLAMDMTLRSRGRDVEVTAPGLRRAFPDATPRLAVFVHGLCETEEAWSFGGARHVPYGFRLQAELGYTPLYLRYNTGRHISENGRQLGQMLDELAAAWPTEVHEIVLVGHSMGGLVARSACHYSEACQWCSKVRHVFTLGTPHRGAPLEQAANAATAALARLPETRGLAKALNIRSAGIKDLRYGYLVDECWQEQDCDAFMRNSSREIPFLPRARHYFLCATISREADAPVGRIIGDLLVLQPSAWAHEGRGKRLLFGVDHYYHLGGASHFHLLNHPAIYSQIRRCLFSQRALPAPAGA